MSQSPAHRPRSIACIQIPNFCWQVEASGSGYLSGGRAALIAGDSIDLPEGGFAHERSRRKREVLRERVVLDCSPGLAGVIPGMPLGEAMSRHSEAVLVEADVPRYRTAFDRILDALEQRVPEVEDGGPGTAYAGIGGLERLYGDDAHVVRVLGSAVEGFDACIGVGENKWLASMAAQLSRPGSGRKVIGEPGQFLARFAVDFLPVPYEAVKRLHSFALHTMGAVADLQQGPMEAQFGPIGGTIWRLSSGLDGRPLVPRKRVESVSEYVMFPDATVTMSTIVSGIESLLTKAFSRPEMARRYARKAELQAQVFRKPPWTMRVAFKEPAGSKNNALFAIKAKLDNTEIPGPLEDLRLTLSELSGESWRQESMWKEVQREGNLRESVSQLRARLGMLPPVYQVRELEPWSRIPERRHALVQLNP